MISSSQNETRFKYLSFSERDIQWQIYCTGTGYANVPSHSPYPISEHPPQYNLALSGRVLQEFQIVYITRGTGYFKTRHQTFKISSGTILLLMPGVWHTYHPEELTGWEEHWVGFKGKYPESLIKSGFIEPGKQIYQVGLDDFFSVQYSRIREFAEEERPGYQQRVGSAVMGILAAIFSIDQQTEQTQESDELVKKVKFLLMDNVYKPLDIENFFNGMGIQYHSFRDAFKQHTGMSPYQYFLHLKVNQAKFLLKENKLSIKEIAHVLSFENPCYFSRLFKKKTGSSPSQWQG